MDKVLILTDGKAGHENQSKALARALGCEYDLVRVAFRSPLAKLASYILDHLGIRTMKLFKPVDGSAGTPRPTNREDGGSAGTPPPNPNTQTPKHPNNPYRALLGTGSGTFYAVKALALQLGVKGGVVLYPRGYALGSFDCILAPAFDRPSSAANVIEIPANLVADDDFFYEQGVAAFAEHYARTTGRAFTPPDNAFAVIVGGPNKCSTMSVAWLKGELDRLFDFKPGTREPSNPAVVHWVTTSRRTPPEVEALIDTYPWDYKLLYSKDHFNPIPAFVKLARRLYVTAESTGMLSEACTCGSAEVYALDNLKPGPHKFRRFVEDLRAGGYVEGNRKVNLGGELARARELLGL